ncbi:MAG: sigma-54-dependent Fis family transcriptional regulator [Peptococcaceae bacterium]|nr:sigma-54-dependent Fis family transcriptional regulator [Peptococcaceae bacterium]
MEFQYQAWETFVKKGKINEATSLVNPIIMASWTRCKNRNQNSDEAASLQLPQEEVHRRKEANRSLIKVAKPFLEELYSFVKGSGFVVVLLDKDACILEILGDQDILQRFKHFRVGEIWDEETKGTNAMGVVKIEKIPVQVYATEHYVLANHCITCSGAPIFAPNGEMIGILDVSGDFNKVHMHTLGMVVAAEKAIENELRLKAANAEVIKSYNNVNAIIETISEGIISFDENGRITNMNPVALSILNMDHSNYQGKLLKSILQNEDILHYILKSGRSIFDHEFILEKNHKQVRFLFSGQPIIDHTKEICGGVAIIREIKNVHRLINQMVGARALFTFRDIIGESESIKNCIRIALDIADSTSSIILQGESGTGKEMFAQAIHNASSFSHGPFIAINCGAIPRDLIESELFGYEDGAFTGARRGGRAGKFELANDGTIFLDEIGDMPFDTQVSLLRVLQEKQVVRIGGYKPIPINVRVIAATNKVLKEEVRKGNFREDLFYRLSVININVPPLRKREGDVLLLAKYYLRKVSVMLGFEASDLEPQAANSLENYDWPGNVRELANAMERAVNLAKGKNIKLEHLPEHLQKLGNGAKNKGTSKECLEELEKEVILNTLESVDWNISKGSSILGIARNTLYRKMDKYGIVAKNY